MDRAHTAHGQAVKDIYVYPLARDARQPGVSTFSA
jgi:hypothetical protein